MLRLRIAIGNFDVKAIVSATCLACPCLFLRLVLIFIQNRSKIFLHRSVGKSCPFVRATEKACGEINDIKNFEDRKIHC